MCYTKLINETDKEEDMDRIIACRIDKLYPDKNCVRCRYSEYCWKNSRADLGFFF